jgi:hypothetical protein
MFFCVFVKTLDERRLKTFIHEGPGWVLKLIYLKEAKFLSNIAHKQPIFFLSQFRYGIKSKHPGGRFMRKRKTVGFSMLAAILFFLAAITSYGQSVQGSGLGSVGIIKQTNNTAYLNSYWFSGVEVLTDTQMKDRVLQLQTYQIKYQLADIGMLVSSTDSLNGTLPAEGYTNLARWIKNSREADPNQKIIVLVNDSKRTIWNAGQKVGNPSFGDATYNTNLRAVADSLINKGIVYNGVAYKADGIQFDFESFMKDDQALKATSQYVRAILPQDAIFSIAAPAHPSVWSDGYLKEMAGIFNLLSPMMYDQLEPDYWVNSAETYQQFWKQTIIRYAHAIADSGHPETRLNPTMPAYGAKATETGFLYHDPKIENIYNASIGLQMARVQLATDRLTNPNLNPNGVHGSGIFWWSSFIYQGVNPWDGHDYAQDRKWWVEEWLQK